MTSTHTVFQAPVFGFCTETRLSHILAKKRPINLKFELMWCFQSAPTNECFIIIYYYYFVLCCGGKHNSNSVERIILYIKTKILNVPDALMQQDELLASELLSDAINHLSKTFLELTTKKKPNTSYAVLKWSCRHCCSIIRVANTTKIYVCIVLGLKA